MSIRQVWKRKTPLPKSSPIFHNDSPPPPPTNTPHSISPPMNYPQRDKMINQLQTISILIEYETPSPPSSPHPLVQPPTNAQVGCHASFCHCCREGCLEWNGKVAKDESRVSAGNLKVYVVKYN
ncbi:hypothetical protein Tco_1063844 [Tanacetum coccineum]